MIQNKFSTLCDAAVFLGGNEKATMATGGEQQMEGKAVSPVTLQNTSVFREQIA